MSGTLITTVDGSTTIAPYGAEQAATAVAAAVITTAADRVQTGLDAVATAADRVQTGLDRVATAADVVLSNAIVSDVSAALAAGTVSDLVGTRIYDSKALLDADLVPADGEYALVLGDATAANNDLYVKSGATTTGSWTGPLGFFAAASAEAIAAADVAVSTQMSVADNSNLFPDAFFSDCTLAGGFRADASISPIAFSGLWTSLSAEAGRTYKAGKVLRRPNSNVTTPQINIYLGMMGIIAGETIQVAAEMRFGATATDTTNVFALGRWYDRAGIQVGANFNLLAASGGNPMTATLTTFNSGNLIVPAGAATLQMFCNTWAVAQDYLFESLQIVKGTALARPYQAYQPGQLGARINALEANDPTSKASGLLLRRTEYSALTVGADHGAFPTASAQAGYGQSFQAAAWPVAGANAIQNNWSWTTGTGNEPTEIYVVVSTAATGNFPANKGLIVGWGKIGVDPLAGNAGTEPVELFDMDGNPKTIMPADLSDLFSIGYFGLKKDGSLASGLAVGRVVKDVGIVDPAYQGYYSVTATGNGIAHGWGTSVNSVYMAGFKIVSLTNPVTRSVTPSAAFATLMGARIAELPNMAALPSKMWAIVGKPCWLHYDTIQTRSARGTAFDADMSGLPAGSGNFEEGFKFVPSAAGTKTLAISASANGSVTSSGSVSFSTVAAATGAGTARFLMIGDSLTENSGVQTRLNALSAADGVTSIVNMGSKGADPIKNEGWSGKPTSFFFGSDPTNPFGSGFDFSTYMTNLAVADPTHVMLAPGFWDAAYSSSDGSALGAAAAWATQIESMISIIHAYNAAIKIGVWTQPIAPADADNGQDGDSAQITGLSTERRRRNLILFGGVSIDTFAGREGSLIYSVPVGQTMNPATAYPKGDMEPIDAAVAAQVLATPYADYTALTADLAKADDVIAQVTGLGYYKKVGASGVGHWRPVTESDGFVRRTSDSIHPSVGYAALGDQTFAWLKATI